MNDRQGMVLCGGLFAALGLAHLYGAEVGEPLALALIVLAGIPHGAFDLRFARTKWAAHSDSSLAIAGVYLAIGLAMSALCLLLPAVGLAAFLALSVFHFAEGEMPRSQRVTAIVFAISAILVPIALHGRLAAGYLGYFLGPDVFPKHADAALLGGMSFLVLALFLVWLEAWESELSETVERLVCMVAWVLLPPLSGFAVWFLGRHSRRHLLACRNLFGHRLADLPGDFVAISALAILLIIPLFWRFDPRDLNQLFAASIILVAGLTLPHVIVTHGLGDFRSGMRDHPDGDRRL